MKRYYYFTDSVGSVVDISKDLSHAGVGENRIHVMGGNRGELELAHVHTTTPWEETDLMHWGFIGIIGGIIVGFLFGVVLAGVNAFGLQNATAEVVIVTTALLAAFGGWFGGIIGLQVRNHHIAPYLNKMRDGQYLVMVDADSDVQEETVREVIARRHSEAREAGHEDHYSPLF